MGREYKKQAFQPPVVKAVEVLIETGDFHVDDHRRQPAERERDPREVRHEEFPVPRQQPRARRRHRHRSLTEFARVAGGDRAPDEIRRGGRGSADRDARGDRPRLGQAERPRQGRRRAVPEGVLLDARRGARRPDGPLERLGSEAERARPGQGSGRGRQGDVRQRRARRAHAAPPHPEGRHASRKTTSATAS